MSPPPDFTRTRPTAESPGESAIRAKLFRVPGLVKRVGAHICCKSIIFQQLTARASLPVICRKSPILKHNQTKYGYTEPGEWVRPPLGAVLRRPSLCGQARGAGGEPRVRKGAGARNRLGLRGAALRSMPDRNHGNIENLESASMLCAGPECGLTGDSAPVLRKRNKNASLPIRFHPARRVQSSGTEECEP